MSNEVKCPMPAKVLEVHVQVGDTVTADTVVVTLESMKMEMPIEAGTAGTVASVTAQVGATIQKGETMIVID